MRQRKLVHVSLVVWAFAHGIGGCKTPQSQDSETSGAKVTLEWENLKVGDKFRISPASQVSECYLAGSESVTRGPCGDQEYWQVIAAVNNYNKTVKSLITGDCLEFGDNGKLRTTACVLAAAGGKKPCDVIGPEVMTKDGCELPAPASANPSMTPYQRQVLTLEGSRLAPAYRRSCKPNTVGGRGGRACRYTIGAGDPPVYSDPVVFSKAIGPWADKNDPQSPDDQLVTRSAVKQARPENSTGSFAAEIRWGSIPRITAIAVAKDAGRYAVTGRGWITGIQIFYAGGSKVLIGSCNKDQNGNCIVDNGGRANYQNPIRFDKDEFITAVGMKFGEPLGLVDVSGEPHLRDTRLIELMIKTNKTEKGTKMMLWQGAGDGKVPWQWLTTKPSWIISGFFGGTALLGANRFDKAMMIHSMGVIYVAAGAYKAHHPDAFQKTSKPNTAVSPLAVKDGRLMGATSQNSTFNTKTGWTPRGKTQASQDAQAAYLRFFTDPNHAFSSTFYAGAMGNGTRTSSVRAYFKEGILKALVVHPEGVSGNVQPEIYGNIPEGESPSLYLELGPKEHLTAVQWKSAPKNSDLDGGGRRGSPYVDGPLIAGLRIVTSKNRVAEHAEPGTENTAWLGGLGSPGYAIVGFHGCELDGDVASTLSLTGIINVGAWLQKVSELP